MSGTPTLPAQQAERRAQFEHWVRVYLDLPAGTDVSTLHRTAGLWNAWCAALASGATQPSDPQSAHRPSKEWYAAKIKETEDIDDFPACGALATPPTGEMQAVPSESELIHASNKGYAQGLIDGKAIGALAATAAETQPTDAQQSKRDALIDATAHLAGAASAYRTYAKRHVTQGKAETDAFFSTRVADMDAAVKRARAALATQPPKDKP